MEKYDVKNISNHEKLGNKVLYNLCLNYISNAIPENVSAKSWLIGRSYATSPQRRKNAKKLEIYDFFFERFSKKFVSEKEICNRIDNLIAQINKTNLLGEFDKDKKLILKVMELVSIFNENVGNTMQKIDNPKDADNINNNISFTSKYLHFHCPNNIFIYDSYSFAYARSFMKKYKKEFNTDKIIKDVKDSINDNNISDYISHYIRCYFIATKIFNRIATPREVDNALLSNYFN